jgi:hypothetical protein
VHIKNNLKYGITNDARYTSEIKSILAMAKVAFNKKTLYTSKLDLNLRKKPVKMPHLQHFTGWSWNVDISKSRSEIAGKF